MKYGYLPTILLSLLLHLLLAGALYFNEPLTAKKHSEVKPIKSYIYIKPKVIEPEPVKPLIINTEIQPELPPVIENNIDKDETATTENIANPPAIEEELPAEEIKPAVKSVQQASVKPVIPPKVSRQNAYQQLERLREQAITKGIEQDISNAQAHRSPSIMHANPNPVPKSAVPLTPEQKKQKNTARYGDDIALIKGEDGLCTLEQDLSSVGIEGVKARSAFLCGESKFDQSFRQHMKNVRSKLGKNK